MQMLFLLALGYWIVAVLTANSTRRHSPGTISEQSQQNCPPEVDCDVVSFLTEDDGENDKFDRKSANNGEIAKSTGNDKPPNDVNVDKNKGKYRGNGQKARRIPKHNGNILNIRRAIRDMNYKEFLAMLHASQWLKKIKVKVDDD